MATSAEDALSRAKAIAARLSGKPETAVTGTSPPVVGSNIAKGSNGSSGGGGGGGGTSGKRKRWGLAPATTTTTTATSAATSVATVSPVIESIPGLSDATKRLKQASETVNKRIWVSTSADRPEAHYLEFLSTRLSGIVLSVGKLGDTAITLELKGRGSSKNPPPPGMPEEPMHLMVSGPKSLVDKAEPMVETLLNEADNAPVDPSHLAQKNDSSDSNENGNDNSLALTTTGSSSSYRPATVAQLIGNVPNVLAGVTGELIEEEIGVPNGVVGFLIGRGGETISSMQARSGCKIQIQKEHELQPGQVHRIITLSAPTKESVDQCREMIESMVQDRIKAAGGSVPGSATTSTTNNNQNNNNNNNNNNQSSSKEVKVNEALAAGHHLVTVDVPDNDVGLIIGKMGSTIKSIQESTGASIQIPTSGNPDNPQMRTVSVTHPNESGANEAKKKIEDLLKNKSNHSNQNTQITIQVLVPDKDVGLCIGRSGCVIREMQQKTGSRIQIPSQPTPGQAYRIATISGTKDGCGKVQALIERIINDQSSACVMSGSPYNAAQGQYYNGQKQTHHNNNNHHHHHHKYYRHHHHQQHQHHHQQSRHTQDGNENSAEWQAYYAAQAVVQQQQASQTQVAQTQQLASAAVAVPHQGAATTNTTAPSSDAYHEQFFRYAYYYGEDAARKYYGAWSPPAGTPNPYGVNPNGFSQPPAAEASAAAAPAPAPAQAVAPVNAQVRDTSVRKVSNLPAWMTRG